MAHKLKVAEEEAHNLDLQAEVRVLEQSEVARRRAVVDEVWRLNRIRNGCGYRNQG